MREVKENEFKTKAEKCAKEIIQFCIKHDLGEDTLIYANNKRFSFIGNKDLLEDLTWDNVRVEDDVNPHLYLEWAGDFLSMSFEGGMWDVFNSNWSNEIYDKWEQEISKIFGKYGKYYELGDAWNLSLYDI